MLRCGVFVSLVVLVLIHTPLASPALRPDSRSTDVSIRARSDLALA